MAPYLKSDAMTTTYCMGEESDFRRVKEGDVFAKSGQLLNGLLHISILLVLLAFLLIHHAVCIPLHRSTNNPSAMVMKYQPLTWHGHNGIKVLDRMTTLMAIYKNRLLAVLTKKVAGLIAIAMLA